MTTQTQPIQSNEVAIILPQEVEQIAKTVSAEKRNEVQSVLNHVFDGVAKMRHQLDSIVVKDENDKVNMKLAKAGDKEKLRKWLTGFSKSNIEIQTKGEAGAVKEEIEKKFDSFIMWAN